MASRSNHKRVFRQFGQKIGQRSLQVAQDVAIVMSDKVIHRTPVDTGRARGNWTPALNTIEQRDAEVFDVSGDVTARQARNIALAMHLGQVFTLSNSVPYIFRLEYLGWSRQAPFGFLGITVAEFQQIVRQAVLKRARGRA